MDIEFKAQHKGSVRKLRLHGTERQWELQKQAREKDQKTGKMKTIWRSFRYYTSLDSALRNIGEAEYRQAASVKAAIASLTAIGAAVQAATAGFVGLPAEASESARKPRSRRGGTKGPTTP